MPASPAGRALLRDHTRRGFLAGSGALLATVMLPRISFAAPAAPAAFDYWAFADRMQGRLDRYWEDTRYQPARSMFNANMLLTHSAAALAGHTGPSRHDERAATIVSALVDGPAWVKTPGSGSQAHVPGWRDGLEGGGVQHLVVDTEIAWALSVAWRAREALGLDPVLADKIADRVVAVAGGSFWRWPALRLNQINWYARVYAAAASVGGPSTELYGELLKQLRRFVDGARRPMKGATISNLGPSYRFHYLPGSSENHKYNLDSAEYANIVCGFLVAYGQARAGGMAALDSTRASVVRAWVDRVLCGYWTHAGYLNWDTGLGFKRWHQGKKLGLSQAALLGIASSAELRPSAAHGAWAKYMLDRSFELFDRWCERAHGIPPANAFDVPAIEGNESSATLAAARVQANAASAVLLGLDSMPSVEPPPLYAYDPDVGRLAVTTPAYNTAVVAVNRGAFPYGGIELARLFDGQQDVAAGVGGRPPASFGVVVRDGSGRIVAASQRAVSGSDPLELLDAPSRNGPVHAGPFKTLRVRGTVRDGGITIRTTHRFTASFVETEWKVTGAGSHTVEVLFPSWGASARAQSIGAGQYHVQSEDTGYVVSVRSGGGKASSRRVAKQSSDPHPGPTLAIRMSGGAMVARIAPARTAEDARAVVASLG